jgi:hypothetical protein
MGKVTVNVVGVWRKGHAQPLWVMSNLAPEQALAIYAARMKIGLSGQLRERWRNGRRFGKIGPSQVARCSDGRLSDAEQAVGLAQR